MKPIQFRHNYQEQNWDPGTINNEPSKVQPEHELDLEINNIMDRYVKTGYMPLPEIAPTFADLSVPMDFAAAQEKILFARQQFISLPIEIRDEFRTAEAFLEAFQNSRGQAKLESLGVLQKLPENEPKDPTAKRGQPKAPAVAPAEQTPDKE